MTANTSPGFFAKVQKRTPLSPLLTTKTSPIERVNLIGNLHSSDVPEKSPNRITLGVMDIIEFACAQPLNGHNCRVPRIVHHHHQVADLGRETGHLLNQKRTHSTLAHIQNLLRNIFRSVA